MACQGLSIDRRVLYSHPEKTMSVGSHRILESRLIKTSQRTLRFLSIGRQELRLRQMNKFEGSRFCGLLRHVVVSLVLKIVCEIFGITLLLLVFLIRVSDMHDGFSLPWRYRIGYRLTSMLVPALAMGVCLRLFVIEADRPNADFLHD